MDGVIDVAGSHLVSGLSTGSYLVGGLSTGSYRPCFDASRTGTAVLGDPGYLSSATVVRRGAAACRAVTRGR